MVHEVMKEEDTAQAWLQEVRQIGRRYLVSSRVWEALFEAVSSSRLGEDKYEVLKAIYWAWRGGSHVESVVGGCWAWRGGGASWGCASVGRGDLRWVLSNRIARGWRFWSTWTK